MTPKARRRGMVALAALMLAMVLDCVWTRF